MKRKNEPCTYTIIIRFLLVLVWHSLWSRCLIAIAFVWTTEITSDIDCPEIIYNRFRATLEIRFSICWTFCAKRGTRDSAQEARLRLHVWLKLTIVHLFGESDSRGVIPMASGISRIRDSTPRPYNSEYSQHPLHPKKLSVRSVSQITYAPGR